MVNGPLSVYMEYRFVTRQHIHSILHFNFNINYARLLCVLLSNQHLNFTSGFFNDSLMQIYY